MQLFHNRALDKQDLSAEATFRHNSKKFPRYRIESVKEQKDKDGAPLRVPGTGFVAHFRNWEYRTRNSTVLKKLLNHKDFNTSKGFRINETDPTGFWRAMGMIKEKEVKTFELVNEVSEEAPDVGKMTVAAIRKRLTALPKEGSEELVTIGERV